MAPKNAGWRDPPPAIQRWASRRTMKASESRKTIQSCLELNASPNPATCARRASTWALNACSAIEMPIGQGVAASSA
eukprot:scaffold330500_cov59-Tisochrysis_lutea.AAC.6